MVALVSDPLVVVVSERDVADLAGSLAELSIAVHDTKTVELRDDSAKRLDRAQRLVRGWDDVFRKRDELRRAESAVA